MTRRLVFRGRVSKSFFDIFFFFFTDYTDRIGGYAYKRKTQGKVGRFVRLFPPFFFFVYLLLFREIGGGSLASLVPF